MSKGEKIRQLPERTPLIEMLISIPYFVILLKLVNLPNASVDVGCGKGSLAGIAIHSPRRRLRCSMIGVDLFLPYLQKARELETYDGLVLASATCLPFKDSAFDMVTSFEVLEHLSKPDGYRAIKEFKRIGKRIFLTTPNGFIKNPTPRAVAINPWQKHLSGWTPAEMKHLGFKVRGISGLQYGKEKSGIWRWPYFLASLASSLIIYIIPSVAFRIFCVWTST